MWRFFLKDKIVWVKTQGDECLIMNKYVSPVQTIYVVQAIKMIKYRDERYVHVFYFQ